MPVQVQTTPSSFLPQPNEVVVAVMGPTGSGKSTFINTISGSQLSVGFGLKSCTAGVGKSKTFDFYERRVTLIDTPGFDDTNLSDTDVLKMIALYLSTTYEHGFKLSGIIYMHRISDFRVGGVSRRNFSMFRKLCGDDTLKNVVIVTNMWGEVTPERGAARELELQTDDMFFKPAMDKGAQMVRHMNTRTSAEAILLQVVHNTPLPLRIQQELVDEGRDITETAAGEELNQELKRLAQEHHEQLLVLQKEMEAAIQAKDEQTKEELGKVRAELMTNIQKIEYDRDRLSQDYEREKRQADLKVKEITETLKREERHHSIREEEIHRLTRELEKSKMISGREREQMRKEIEDLKHANTQSKSSSGGWSIAAGVLGMIVDTALMVTLGVPPVISPTINLIRRSK